MGSSYSKGTRTSPSVRSTSSKKGSSTKSKTKDTSNTSSDQGTCDVDNNLEHQTGNIVHERKDSKKFWVSHVKFRKSSGDLRRTSSEKRPEIHKDDKTTAKPTTRHKQNSKTVLLKSSSFDSAEGTSSQSRELHEDSRRSRNNNDGVKSGNSEQGVNCSQHSVVANADAEDAKYRLMTVIELYNILNDGALSPCICDPSYVLILDTRSIESYERSHILLARPSTSLYSDLQSYNYLHGFSTSSTSISNAVNEFTWVIIYGDPIDPEASNIEDRPEIKLYKELEGNYKVEPYLISAGFSSFENSFPFLCTENRTIDYKTLKVYPSIILDNQLYQGRGDQATNIKVIVHLKITHIVNITQEHKNAFPDKVEYLSLKLDDVPQTQLIKHFETTSAFLADAFNSGGRVLVHCNLGVSRSSSVSIAYLIQSRGWTLSQAYDYIKERRTCIRPNRGFLQQLSVWEEKILGKKYTDPDDLWF